MRIASLLVVVLGLVLWLSFGGSNRAHEPSRQERTLIRPHLPAEELDDLEEPPAAAAAVPSPEDPAADEHGETPAEPIATADEADILELVRTRLRDLQDGDGGWRSNDARWGRRGTTALSCLTYLGMGILPGSDGLDGASFDRALEFLQASEPGEAPYEDAAVALLLAEAAVMCRDPEYEWLTGAAKEALARLEAAALADGGWSAGTDAADVGATGLAAMALKSASLGVGTDDELLARTREWFLARQPHALQLRQGETLAGEREAAAFTILGRAFLGRGTGLDDSARAAAQVLASSPGATTAYLEDYLATMALFQIGGDAWDRWQKHLEEAPQDLPTDPAEAALFGLTRTIHWRATRVR